METRSGRLPPILLAGLALLGAAPLVRPLIVADLNLCYPFLTADSYDWISNGLFWLGRPVLPSLRPPGLPFLIAVLSKAGLLPLFPVASFLFHGVSTALLYLLLRERHDAWIAATASWFFFSNDAVLDLAKYVLAETFATPFLVLAVLAFVRAERDHRWYLAVGGALGAGFLFSYAAAPVAVGLAAAVLSTRARDLKRIELWLGVTMSSVAVVGWFAVRSWYQRAHPGAPRHDFEALLRLSAGNLTFYALALPALLGLLLLPLYIAGAARLSMRNAASRGYRTGVSFPAASLVLFLFFLYDWPDKRFLVYLLPVLSAALAEGLELLREVAAGGRLRAIASAAYLGACLLWNGIRYPSYGFPFVALTPRTFLEARVTTAPNFKTEMHLDGARIVRLHRTWPSAFAGGLFDARTRAAPCSLSDPEFACLGALKGVADRLLASGEAIGFRPPAGWPVDAHASFIRLRNAFERPVVDPGAAALALASTEAVPRADLSRPPFVARCGPYVLVRTR